MTNFSRASHTVALHVMQQAAIALAAWARSRPFAEQEIGREEVAAIDRAKTLLEWPNTSQAKPIGPLRQLFDRVQLPHATPQTARHYWPALAIADSDPPIPYPLMDKTDVDVKSLQRQVKEALDDLSSDDCQNLSLLMLILEKFGSHLGFGSAEGFDEAGEADVSLCDRARATAAVAAALAERPEATDLSLVVGDLSGIQNFIYTIASSGALKSLRARSFYLELVTEEIVQQLLEKIELPRTNVIYAGGGNLYLLAPARERLSEIVQKVRDRVNRWLWGTFQGKVFLGLDVYPFPAADVGNSRFAQHWQAAIQKMAPQKTRKFDRQLDELLEPKPSYEPCRVCHRDDVETLKPLNPKEPDSPPACDICRDMFHLGSQLFRVKAMVRSRQPKIPNAVDSLTIGLAEQPIYYHLFQEWEKVPRTPEPVLLINDWEIAHYQGRSVPNVAPLLLGNHGPKTQLEGETGFMSASEMAERASRVGAIPRVGSLRMDVDRLGQIFAQGLGNAKTFPRLTALSRQMSYFFKVYLNSLAKHRQANFLTPPKTVGTLQRKTHLSDEERPDLLFIYAGGDDLFVSGAWNQVVEFAFDVYQSFRAYTGWNAAITLSGGVSIHGAKYPLYQAADAAGAAEDAAKGNGRDSLGLFGEVFKWSEWLGIKDRPSEHVAKIESKDKDEIEPKDQARTADETYKVEILAKLEQPELLGIFPFVERLDRQKVDINYSRNFVRNLLLTAQVQNQMIQEIEEQRKPKEYDFHLQDIRYYLHLPQIAYTLARLPKNAFDDDAFRQSLKHPWNAPYFRAIATWIELLNRAANS